ncbi:hypothetical protein O3I_040135 [Nocardia brasiliensis ATCC 700358]|uniref:Uncharacterized protein n=1 Tax=Nocardia brasiliensis (strain ATCC 700358 / HUJEG-1) TaxID=1133849 RepID=K0F8E6_NOCB7|nr:hypothetical protein O3I_040135 [Nocardia brasiliensis ATCC 700358]
MADCAVAGVVDPLGADCPGVLIVGAPEPGRPVAGVPAPGRAALVAALLDAAGSCVPGRGVAAPGVPEVGVAPGAVPGFCVPRDAEPVPWAFGVGAPCSVPPSPAAGIGRVAPASAGRSPLFALGLLAVSAPGRASGPAGVAGSALSRAGFLLSFGSDTHYPSVRRNILNSTASLTARVRRSPTSDPARRQGMRRYASPANIASVHNEPHDLVR